MNTQPLARRNDPVTSYLAADRAREFAGSHKEQIMQALASLNQATAQELADATDMQVVQIDRRMVELQRVGRAVVACCNGSDYIRDGFRVWEIPMSSYRREKLIKGIGAAISAFMSMGDVKSARKLQTQMNGLIKCRAVKQIKKMEKEKGLV